MTRISEQLMPPNYVLTLPQESDASELNRIRVRSWWTTSVEQGGVPGVNREWLRGGMATYTSPEQDDETAKRIAVARGELVMPGRAIMIVVARYAIDAAGHPVEAIMDVPPTGYMAADKWFNPEIDPYGRERPIRQELSTLQTGLTGSGIGPAMMAVPDEEAFWHSEVPVHVGAIQGTYSNDFYKRHGFEPHPDEDFFWTNGDPEYVLKRDLSGSPDFPNLPMACYQRRMTRKEALAHWALVLDNRNQRVSA